MKKTTYIIFAAFALSGAAMLGGCKKVAMDDYADRPRAHFVYTPINGYKYSFLSTPDAESYLYSIPVQLEGLAVDYDREVRVRILADSTTASADHYVIGKGVIPANKYKGTVDITLKNLPDLKQEEVRLWLVMDDSPDLGAGIAENSDYYLCWDNKMSAPANWAYYKFGEYSTTIHNFMIRVLGVAYLEYGYPDDPNVPNLTSKEMYSIQAKMRTELRAYNLAHPGNPLTHEDGKLKGQPVVIP